MSSTPDLPAQEPAPRPTFVLPKTLALVGLMGVGKTTIGRRLADHFGLPFVDADEEIEKAAGGRLRIMPGRDLGLTQVNP